VQVLIDGVPTRLDAKINHLLFVIISQNSEKQMNWIVQRSVALLNTDEHHEVCFLITTCTQINFLDDKIPRTPLSRRIHIVSTKEQLETLLKKRQNRSITNQPLLTQVA
jgi:hypothetical protein